MFGFCSFDGLFFFSWSDSAKPPMDPAAAKLWTLSANDMEDESVVSQPAVHGLLSMWTRSGAASLDTEG